MTSTAFRTSTRFWGGALAVWAGFSLAGPKVIPGDTTVFVGLVLAGIVFLTTFRVARPPLTPLALAALAVVSGLWAEVPESAYIKGGALVAITLMASVLVANMAPENILRWLSFAFRYSALASIFLALAMPAIGVESRWPNVGAWTGLYVHKNFLGILAVFGVLTLIYSPRFKNVPALTYPFWLAIYALVIVQSKSSAAIILTIAVLGVWLATRVIANRSRQGRGLVVTLMILGGGFLAALAYGALPTVLGIFGRDLTFTGRTRIWEATLYEASYKPWFGHGYESAFEPTTNSAIFIASQVGWVVPHAHNGFLSLMLEVGIIGTALGAIFCLALLMRGFRAVVRDTSPVHRWAFTVGVVFVLNNLIENGFEGLPWFLAVVALILTRRKPNQAHQTALELKIQENRQKVANVRRI